MATTEETLNLRQFLVPQVFPGGQAFSPEEEDFRRDLQDIINNIITLIEVSGTVDGSIGAGFDGLGSVIEALSEVEIVLPWDATITSAVIVADRDGNLEIDVQVADYADFPTMTSIVASAPPSLSAAQKSQDTTLTGWTTELTAGQVVRFVVNSATTVTRAEIALMVTKS